MGGAVYFMRDRGSSNVYVYNSTFKGLLAIRFGGAVSWTNSTNVTIDSSCFNSTASSYGGGAIYLGNIDHRNQLIHNNNCHRF